MAAEARADVHHFAPRCLLGLFDAAAAGGLADCSEFDAEAERWGIEVRGLSREDLSALIESFPIEIPTSEHRSLHQEEVDFVRWGRRGGPRTLALYSLPYFSLLARFRWEFKGRGSLRPAPACIIMVSAYTTKKEAGW